MARNPHATNLRHHRQQIIADKRGEERKREADRVTRSSGCVFYDLDIPCHREGCTLCPTGTSAT